MTVSNGVMTAIIFNFLLMGLIRTPGEKDEKKWSCLFAPVITAILPLIDSTPSLKEQKILCFL
jgi:hypothetical protein